MTVTTADDKVSRWLEVRAPLASRRLRTLTESIDAATGVWCRVRTVIRSNRREWPDQDATTDAGLGPKLATRMCRLTTRAHTGKTSSAQAMLRERRSSVRATR